MTNSAIHHADHFQYCCALIRYEFNDLDNIQHHINVEDLYTENGDRAFGFEEFPHITLLYGIHPDSVSDENIVRMCKFVRIGTINLSNVSVFENAKFDVLKLDAQNDALYRINERLKSCPFTTDYPIYHPHSTIAYLKPGTGKKYVEILKGIEFNVTPTDLVYSKTDGSQIVASLD